MFQSRILIDDDYSTLVDWWKQFRFPPVAQEMLPNNGLGGIIVSKDGIDICAGFLYTTNSKLAWIEFIVSNFEYKSPDRKDAIKHLINDLCAIAKDLGFKAVFTSVKNQSLIKHFEHNGFIQSKATEMVKLL